MLEDDGIFAGNSWGQSSSTRQSDNYDTAVLHEGGTGSSAEAMQEQLLMDRGASGDQGYEDELSDPEEQLPDQDAAEPFHVGASLTRLFYSM